MGITELCPTEDDLFDAPEILPAGAKREPQVCRCGEGDPHPPVVRSGSYWIPDITFTGPAEGDGDVRCMRASNAAKYLADMYSIEQRNGRFGIAGTVVESDEADQIRAELRTLNPRGTKSELKRLNVLYSQLQAVGGAYVEADRGTFMHGLLEQVVAGVAVADLQCTHAERADTEAVLELLDDYGIVLQPQYSERVIVWQQMRIAGRIDGIAEYRGALEVVDLKTGLDPFQYGEKEIIAQQVIYANMEALYRCGLRTFDPRPDRLRSDRSLIICSPYGQAKPYIRSLNLATAKLHWIKAFEAKKYWLKVSGLSSLLDPQDQFLDLPVKERIAKATSFEQLQAIRREVRAVDKALWTPELRALAARKLDSFG